MKNDIEQTKTNKTRMIIVRVVPVDPNSGVVVVVSGISSWQFNSGHSVSYVTFVILHVVMSVQSLQSE